MATYFDQSLAQIKNFEGCVPWMYVDSAGNVTVGVGLMLPNAAAACALAFQVAGADASADQIGDEFARVKALAPDKLPGFYQSGSSPQLPQDIIDAKLSAVLEGFEGNVRAGVPGYDALPDNAKIALLDMAYNLGPGKLLREYPMMLHAVQAGNWTQAAAQCARGGISAARNAWTSQQFLSAAAVSASSQS
jgi:GH24 family phage-related lysozyme (muramidase)